MPIVNKRTSITPARIIYKTSKCNFELAETLDKATEEICINFLGGYTTLAQKIMSKYKEEFIKSIPDVLTNTKKLCSSVSVPSIIDGIYLDAIKLLGNIINNAANKTR